MTTYIYFECICLKSVRIVLSGQKHLVGYIFNKQQKMNLLTFQKLEGANAYFLKLMEDFSSIHHLESVKGWFIFLSVN